MGDVVYLVTLTTGHYSDTHVRFLCVYDSWSDADAAALRFDRELRNMLARLCDAEDRGEYAEATPAEMVAAGLGPEDRPWAECLGNDPRYEIHKVLRGSL